MVGPAKSEVQDEPHQRVLPLSVGVVTPGDIVAERVLQAPYEPCYYLLYRGKVVAVVYWEDEEIEGAPPQFFYFLAESTRQHQSLQSGDPRPSLEVALADAMRLVADELSRRDPNQIVGLEDLPPSELPWRLLTSEDP